MTLQTRTVQTSLLTALASVVTIAGLAVISYAQFLIVVLFYGYGTQRAMDFIDKGQPVPEWVASSNIFFMIILPNMLAFCLYLAVFWLCSPAPRERKARIYSALAVSAVAVVLVFLFAMAAGIARYGP